MADDSDPSGTSAPAPSASPVDGHFRQRGLADRLFPGPSRRMSNQLAEHIDGLLRPLEGDGGAGGLRGGRIRPTDHPAGPRSGPDIAEVRDSLEQQNELLRAILSSTVDTQTDARSTAQNSRTFAWASTVIAFLTLIATVISVVAAVRAR